MCILQRVERVFAGGLRRSDVRNHDRLRVSEERVAQNVRQLALAIRRVIGLLVDAPYALLQLNTVRCY